MSDGEETLFDRVLQQPLAERAEFLDRVCREDPVLRRRLEVLLAAHEDPGSFLATPAWQRRGGAAFEPGAAVGPYLLGERIGQGAMGEVFRAEQREPFQRTVALKVLRPGLDTRQILARFAAERQALALMSHPSIASVFDSGRSTDGRPFFAMELVDGPSITDYCDARAAPLEQRLRLLIEVCLAVQHAHQKGVVHRDLKPSNVLVATYDGQPVPKIIDFGVAKATSVRLTEETLHTVCGMIVGTVGYMSPEQADLAGADVDTRTDVYALGVLCHELLVGSTPLRPPQGDTTAILEAIRVLRERDPELPSVRAAGVDDSVARRRGLNRARLVERLRGDLDWIVTTALARDRDDRYASAGELAADLRRHLAGDPVSVGPPALGYRLRKLAGRHRTALRVAVAFCSLLVAATVVSVEQANRARAAGREASRANRQTLEAVGTLTDQVVERLLFEQASLTATDRRFLERIAELSARLGATAGNGLDSRLARAEGAHRLGQIRGRLGDSAAAVESLTAAIGEYRKLVALDGSSTAALQGLGDATRRLGAIRLAMGDRELALEQFREAARSFEAMGAGDPAGSPRPRLGFAAARLAEGDALLETGRADDARIACEHAVELLRPLVEHHPGDSEFRVHLASALGRLITCLDQRGDTESAEPLVREGIAVLEPARESGVVEVWAQLAAFHGHTAKLRQRHGDRTGAVESLREVVALRAAVAARLPLAVAHRDDLATARRNLAVALANSRDLAAALAEIEASLAIYERLTAEHADNPKYRASLALARDTSGVVLAGLGRMDDAENAWGLAIREYEALVAEFPENTAHAEHLGASVGNLANVHRARGRLPAAVEHYGRALEILDSLREPSAMAKRFAFRFHLGRALSLRALGQRELAIRDARACVSLAGDDTQLRGLLAAVRDLTGDDGR